MSELTRPTTKLIHRWPGHGDLWMFDDSGARFMRADQVEALAGIRPWSGGESLFAVDELVVVDGHACYPLEVAIARCESDGGVQAAEFLRWLRPTVELTDDDAVLAATIAPSFIGSYPVNVAARTLSADPEVQIGRDGLFAFMAELGWLSRDERLEGDWEISAAARRAAWLTVRNVPVPGRRGRLYPQPYVTPAGLAELHRLLTVDRRHSPPAAPPPPPALFD